MATGQEMLIANLLRLLGLDKHMAQHVMTAVQLVTTFDARLARIEQRLGIALGEQHHVERTSNLEGAGLQSATERQLNGG